MVLLADGVTLVDGGRAVLRELDIADPIDCLITSGRNALDGVSSDLPLYECGEQEEEVVITRQKRNIGGVTGSWDTLEIPYMLDESLFCKCFVKMHFYAKQK